MYFPKLEKNTVPTVVDDPATLPVENNLRHETKSDHINFTNRWIETIPDPIDISIIIFCNAYTLFVVKPNFLS